MSSSTIDAIYTAVMDQLKKHERQISDKEAGEVASILQGRKYETDVSNTVDDVYNSIRDELDDMSTAAFDREVERVGRIIADSLLYIALDNARTLKYINEDEERDLERAKRDLERIISRGGRDRDRGRDRNRSRDRDRDNGRDRNRSRRENDRNRSNKSDRPNRLDRDRDESPRNREVEEERTTSVNTVRTGLDDRDVLTNKNAYLLEAGLRDTPIYYAGLEKLIYNAETNALDIVIFGENIKVDYEEHRTDLYLQPNRGVKNIGRTVEEMQEQMAKAAQERVDAFAKAETPVEGAVNNLELRRPITSPTVIDGIFNIDHPITNSEKYIREELSGMYGDKVNNFVYSVNVEHDIAVLTPRVKVSDVQTEKLLDTFRSQTNSLSQLINLSALKDWVEAAQELMTDEEYSHLHSVVNEVVCNALTLSMKTRVRTPSWVVDYDAIVNVVQSRQASEPNFDMVLLNNLTTLMPNLIISEGKLQIIRTYIFLPFSKNEIVFASPNAYGVVAQNTRPQFFDLLKSIHSSLVGIGIRPWYTIVTSDNAILTSRPVYSATSESFYLFKPQ